MLKLAIDMDEVMADTWSKFIHRFKEQEGFEISAEMLHGKELWQAVPESLTPRVREWINEKNFFRDLPVMPGAREVVAELCNKYEVFVASAASEFPNSYKDKYDWLQDHFPFISWKHIVFCGDKSIINADIMIDDRIRNFTQFKGRPILYTSPHNVNVTHYERVNNWDEVAGLLL
ncbi:5' nucleotidase, NT5C type [Solitalea koreensis]|uniref:5'(3')-deoxyribonucleotidase n=1 Tax=Solitalea koreensis TaxID=543615 RepID=A0A521C0N7_9SPHI|nr:5'(3')-deoxyribonucleotidase [Solitalea koreensis]SMO53009.1 5'(3')-deoxyribonucleotidase [Solitalea koreensis]